MAAAATRGRSTPTRHARGSPLAARAATSSSARCGVASAGRRAAAPFSPRSELRSRGSEVYRRSMPWRTICSNPAIAGRPSNAVFLPDDVDQQRGHFDATHAAAADHGDQMRMPSPSQPSLRPRAIGASPREIIRRSTPPGSKLRCGTSRRTCVRKHHLGQAATPGAGRRRRGLVRIGIAPSSSLKRYAAEELDVRLVGTLLRGPLPGPRARARGS